MSIPKNGNSWQIRRLRASTGALRFLAAQWQHVQSRIAATANSADSRPADRGGGGNIPEFFDANDPNVERFNSDPVPQSLTLGSTGTDITDFFAIGGGVYVVTNGISNENDQSGTVIFDPSGGPADARGNAPQAARGGPRQAPAERGHDPMMVDAPTKVTAGTGNRAVGSPPVQAASAALDWADAIDNVCRL